MIKSIKKMSKHDLYLIQDIQIINTKKLQYVSL